jgi:predicted small lipoprotein YifL
MKNIKLLITTFIFSSLLVGCGMTGPLYRAPEPTPQGKEQKAATTEAVEAKENSTAILEDDSQSAQ